MYKYIFKYVYIFFYIYTKYLFVSISMYVYIPHIRSVDVTPHYALFNFLFLRTQNKTKPKNSSPVRESHKSHEAEVVQDI